MQNYTQLKNQVLTLINYDNIGDTRIYNLCKNELGIKRAVKFMVEHLGYETWYVNKLIYIQNYNKRKYKIQKLNSPNNI